MHRPRYLDVFRGLGLVAILCWQSISILAGKLGRIIKDWAGGDWHGLDGGSSSVAGDWECELCGVTGRGDARSFFCLDEVEHLLATGCMGSLRRHEEPEPAASSHKVPEPAASSRSQGEKKARVPTTACLDHRREFHGETGSESVRQIALGLGWTWVLAGQTLFINMVAREPFRVQRILVPSAVAVNFMIEGLMIGGRELLPSRIPAILFTETCAEIAFFGGDVGYPGVITMSVTNMSKKGSWFQGAVMGPPGYGSPRPHANPRRAPVHQARIGAVPGAD